MSYFTVEEKNETSYTEPTVLSPSPRDKKSLNRWLSLVRNSRTAKIKTNMLSKQSVVIFKNDVIKNDSEGKDCLPKTGQLEGKDENVGHYCGYSALLCDNPSLVLFSFTATLPSSLVH